VTVRVKGSPPAGLGAPHLVRNMGRYF